MISKVLDQYASAVVTGLGVGTGLMLVAAATKFLFHFGYCG